MAKPELHYHGCTHCKRRYPDACEDRKPNTCPSCRMGRTSIYMTGIDPRPCCTENARLANKDDLKTYRLAGPGPWWLCRECARQFAFDPRNAHV